MDLLSNTLPHYRHFLQAVLLPFDTDCLNIPSYFLCLHYCPIVWSSSMMACTLIYFFDIPALQKPLPHTSPLTYLLLLVRHCLCYRPAVGSLSILACSSIHFLEHIPTPNNPHPFPLTYLLLQVPHCSHYRLVVWSLSILACSWIYFFEHIPTPSSTPTPFHWPTFFSRPLSVFIIVLLYGLFQYWLVLGYTSLSISQPLNNPPIPSPLTYLLLQAPHCLHYRLVVWSLSILACSSIYFSRLKHQGFIFKTRHKKIICTISLLLLVIKGTRRTIRFNQTVHLFHFYCPLCIIHSSLLQNLHLKFNWQRFIFLFLHCSFKGIVSRIIMLKTACKNSS